MTFHVPCINLCTIRRRLAGARFVTFSVEKAVTGLLRLASRLYQRPGIAASFSPALPWLTAPHVRPQVFSALAGHISAGMLRLAMATGAGTTGAGVGGRAGYAAEDVRGQRGGEGGGGGPRETEWGAVLSVLEACAGSGGAGQAETFEAVCLLVHNQDLKEVLPVDGVTRCISAFFVAPVGALGAGECDWDGGGEADSDGEAEEGGHFSNSDDEKGIGKELLPSSSSSSLTFSSRPVALFAAAALDLLMVLHARLPAVFGIVHDAGTMTPDKESSPAAATVTVTSIARDGSETIVGDDCPFTLGGVGGVGGIGWSCRSAPSGDGKASGSVGRGEARDGEGDGGLGAWMVILRALSLGARTGERDVGMHALQLLTKVCSRVLAGGGYLSTN